MGNLLSIKDIKGRLPFRYPFLLIDRAEIVEHGVNAVKNLTMDEEFFQGHFPGAPIMPGVLQVESMFQTASLFLNQGCDCERCIPLLTGLKKVKFRKPVLPGDVLFIEITVDSYDEKTLEVSAKTLVDGAVTSQAQLTISCVKKNELMDLLQPTALLQPLKAGAVSVEQMEDVTVIQNVIPHRYPFILVDKILSLDVENKVTIGLKNISVNEPFFAGYPEDYCMLPNSLQMEIAAQVGCKYMLSQPENKGKIGYFMAIDKAVYHQPVLPGDQLVVETSLAGSRGRFGKADVKMYVGETLVTECSLKFAIGD